MNKKLILSILFLPLLIISGCPVEESRFDRDMPDFETEAVGTNFETGLSIDLYAYREYDDITGSGELLIDDYKFDIEILDAYLSTDGSYEDPIPQSDNLVLYDYICSPRYSELTVKLTPGDYITTIKLNECEAQNEYEYDDGFFVYNPCNGYEVLDLDHFNGVCLEDEDIGVYYGDDTIEIKEFGKFCGSDVERCLIPKDVFLNVFSFDYSSSFFKTSEKKEEPKTESKEDKS